MFSGHRIIHI